MIVDCAVYESGIRRKKQLDVADAFEAGREPNAFVWIGLYEPTAAEFELVQMELALHPLAIEDALRAHQRPKLDIFDDTIFTVIKTANYDDAAEQIFVGEIHIFAGDSFVVTVRHGEACSLERVRADLEKHPDMLSAGPGAVLYAVLDEVVDRYQLVVDGVENDLTELEAEVFAIGHKNSAARIFRLKREVITFSRAITPLLEVLDRLVRQQIPVTCRHESLPEYFRDVQDHVHRVAGRVDTARDMLGSALEANLAQVSVRQNEDMRAMSGWAAVIAVPTLFAGIWGMNFEKMPELKFHLGYPVALLTIFGSGALVRWKLRRNGWI
jgi:magnesium transporter